MGHPSTEDPLIAERSITFELRLMEAMGIAPDDRGAQMAWAERYAVQVRSLLDDDQSLRALIRDERYADAIAHARPLLEECTT